MEDSVVFKHHNENYYFHHTITNHSQADNFSFKSHSHNMYEIYYFLEGVADFVVDGRIYKLKRGTLILTDRGQTHNTIINSSDKPYERIALLFSSNVISNSLLSFFEEARKGKNCYFLNEKEQVWFEECVKTLENTHISNIETNVLIASTISAIVSKLATMNAVSYTEKTPESEIVSDIIKFVNQNIENDWTLETLEKSLFRDRAYLNRKFKGVMGCGIWEYNLRKRIFSAQQRLYLSKSVSEAYTTSGFKDYSSFFRGYKKYIGMSPSDDLKRFCSK